MAQHLPIPFPGFHSLQSLPVLILYTEVIYSHPVSHYSIITHVLISPDYNPVSTTNVPTTLLCLIPRLLLFLINVMFLFPYISLNSPASCMSHYVWISTLTRLAYLTPTWLESHNNPVSQFPDFQVTHTLFHKLPTSGYLYPSNSTLIITQHFGKHYMSLCIQHLSSQGL